MQGSRSQCWGGVPCSAPAADAHRPDVGVGAAAGAGAPPVQGPLQLAGPAAAVGGHQVGGGLALDDAGQRRGVVGAAFAVPGAAVHPAWSGHKPLLFALADQASAQQACSETYSPALCSTVRPCLLRTRWKVVGTITVQPYVSPCAAGLSGCAAGEAPMGGSARYQHLRSRRGVCHPGSTLLQHEQVDRPEGGGVANTGSASELAMAGPQDVGSCSTRARWGSHALKVSLPRCRAGLPQSLISRLHAAQVLLLHMPTCSPATRGLSAKQQSGLRGQGCCSGCAQARDASHHVGTAQPSPDALQHSHPRNP